MTPHVIKKISKFSSQNIIILQNNIYERKELISLGLVNI